MENALVVSDVAKLRPLEESVSRLAANLSAAGLETSKLGPLKEQVSTLEAQLDQSNCEFGVIDVGRREAFEALDMEHTSAAADLGRVPLLEERVSGLSADLE